MLKINKKLEYALMILDHFRKNEGVQNPISAQKIVDLYKTPYNTTAKMMQLLSHEGILHSIQGPKGGYVMKKPLKDISFFELYQVVEEHRPGNFCLEQNCSMLETCTIQKPILQINNLFLNFLRNLNLDELLNQQVKWP